MEILLNFVGNLGPLLSELADDAGDRRSCLHGERRSDASRRRGSLSATPTVHEHERSLAGAWAGCGMSGNVSGGSAGVAKLLRCSSRSCAL
eukprot:2628878-Prymnesium_polylepis.1